MIEKNESKQSKTFFILDQLEENKNNFSENKFSTLPQKNLNNFEDNLSPQENIEKYYLTNNNSIQKENKSSLNELQEANEKNFTSFNCKYDSDWEFSDFVVNRVMLENFKKSKLL